MDNNDNDAAKLDLPPYKEEFPPFPDVETEFSFYENKEEIYRRNRIIAAEEQARLLKEENRQKPEKQEQFREMTEADKAVNTAKKKRCWDKLVLLDSIIVILGIIALIAALSGRTSKPSASAYGSSFEEPAANSIWAEMRLTETEAAAQVSAVPTITEISEDIFEEARDEEVSAEITDKNCRGRVSRPAGGETPSRQI